MHEVVLCADEEMLRNPAMMGLEDEALDGQEWLLPMSDAQEARNCLRDNPAVDEVWVASSNEVDPINLAAAMKRDRREVRVCLVAWQGSGSLMSRASAAGIDEVMGYPAMAQRYSAMKGLHRAANPRRRTPERVLLERATAPDAPKTARKPAHGRVEPRFERSALDIETASPATAELAGEQQPPETQFAAGDQGAMGGGVSVRTETPEQPTRRGYSLCVVSASGGAGKSTVAALSALIAAGHGYRTALIDGDLQFGDIAGMFGEEPGLSVDQVVADPQLLDATNPRPGVPVVISVPPKMEQSELYLPQMPGLIDRAVESFDVVVVNTGSFWTESHVQMMEVSTNTLFLMDQRPTSVKAVRKALELCARCGVAANPFLFAVNRCTRKSLLSSIDISCALNGVAVAELKEGGPAVAELTAAGMARKLVDDHNDLCVSLNDFLGQVIPTALSGVEVESLIADDRAAKAKGKAKRKGVRRKGKAACL